MHIFVCPFRKRITYIGILFYPKVNGKILLLCNLVQSLDYMISVNEM